MTLKKSPNRKESFIIKAFWRHASSCGVPETALLTRNSAWLRKSARRMQDFCLFLLRWSVFQSGFPKRLTLLLPAPTLSPHPPTVLHRHINPTMSDHWPAWHSSSPQHQRLCSSHYISFHLWKIQFRILWYENVCVCLNEEERARAAMNAGVIGWLVTLWRSMRDSESQNSCVTTKCLHLYH